MKLRCRMSVVKFPAKIFYVEVDETYVGGRRANKRASKKLHVGRGVASVAKA